MLHPGDVVQVASLAVIFLAATAVPEAVSADSLGRGDAGAALAGAPRGGQGQAGGRTDVTNPSRIGRYEILERLGHGGMGVLYRGRDTTLDREVAIKVMSADFGLDADQTARSRFYQEARAAARLQHRNIVTIFEFGEDQQTPFIAMEYLRGQDLAHRMRSTPPLSLEQKLDIVADLCTGLHFAHEQGVVHRDVKPANIWIQTDGSVKLLDFGIAKFGSATITMQGAVLGSAAYMAPEQVAGLEIDGRADVFAAGVVLYELLAGRKPFEGDTVPAVMARLVDSSPMPLDHLPPDTPAALVAAVGKALQKDRDRRYRQAGDLGADLRQVRTARAARASAVPSAEPMTEVMEVPCAASTAPAVAFTPAASADAADGYVLVQPESPLSAAASSPRWFAPAVAGLVLLAAGAVGYFAFAPGAPGRARSAATSSVAGSRGASSTPSAASPTRSGPAHRNAVDSAAPGPPARKGTEVAPARARQRDGSASVVVSGTYAFEVHADGQLLSPMAAEHRLRLSPPQTLRLHAPGYFLDASITVEAGMDRVRAPALGRLQLRIPEACAAAIGGQSLGEPPYSELQIAAGSYRVQMQCPDGNNRDVPILIQPGELRREIIAK